MVECQKHVAERQQFQLETGIAITEVNYVDIMALNATALGVPPNTLTLAMALCQLLAHIVKMHRQENHIASVAQ